MFPIKCINLLNNMMIRILHQLLYWRQYITQNYAIEDLGRSLFILTFLKDT